MKILGLLAALLAVGNASGAEPTAAETHDRLNKACLMVVEHFPDLAQPEVVGIGRADRKVTVALRDSLGLRKFDCHFVDVDDPKPQINLLTTTMPDGSVWDSDAATVDQANQVIQAQF